jgi:YHS domain-containing protein
MTAARNLRIVPFLPIFTAAFTAALLSLTLSTPSKATAATERIVVDWHTGLALGGFDPVAYFVDGNAVRGKGDFEYTFAGVVWQFRNGGNRAAFTADPEVYMPRFGGYDPVAVARGVGVPGDPRLWLILEGRLYFFYTPEAQAAFGANPKDLIETAERNWPAVQLTLSP